MGISRFLHVVVDVALEVSARVLVEEEGEQVVVDLEDVVFPIHFHPIKY
jgi:hypothetical protein